MRCLLLASATLLTSAVAAQPAPPACSAPEYRQLDFWVGDWRARWTDAGGKAQEGRNSIARILGDCAIEERFDGSPGTPLKGRSLSIYDGRAKVWRQTWADNQGGVFVLTGGPQGADFVLETASFGDGGKSRFRMLYTDITPNSFTWDWLRTDDHGKTWKSSWRLSYERLAPSPN